MNTIHPVQQTSLAELHRLSITLSNLFDVAPTIINGHYPINFTKTKSKPQQKQNFIV